MKTGNSDTAADTAADSVDLSEFEALRREINNRTLISTNLILAYITALGVGATVLDRAPDVFIGLAAASSFFWLLWIDHTQQIFKIGSYIGLRLARRIRLRHRYGLGWEEYYRTLDVGGGRAAQELFGSDATARAEYVRHTHNVTHYIIYLFGWTPPLLLVLHSLLVLRSPVARFLWQFSGYDHPSYAVDYVAVVRLCGVIGATVLWGYAIRQYIHLRRSIALISAAFRAKDSPTEVEPSVGDPVVTGSVHETPSSSHDVPTGDNPTGNTRASHP